MNASGSGHIRLRVSCFDCCSDFRAACRCFPDGHSPTAFRRGQRAEPLPRRLHLAVVFGAAERGGSGRPWPRGVCRGGQSGGGGLGGRHIAVPNRVVSGRFGSTVRVAIESPGQFEPVGRAGGQWRNLPPLSATQSATIATIVNLIQQGRLPDPTEGATFFQNPRIVARRAAAGEVPASLTNFGNQVPIAVVRDHDSSTGPGRADPRSEVRRARGAASTLPA